MTLCFDVTTTASLHRRAVKAHESSLHFWQLDCVRCRYRPIYEAHLSQLRRPPLPCSCEGVVLKPPRCDERFLARTIGMI
nr:hypothetical protein CFP56_09001 [Quercus suber]